MTDNTAKKPLCRRVLFWRLLFGTAAGLLLSTAWQLSTSSPGVEQESSYYRYFIAGLIQQQHPVPEICVINADSVQLPVIARPNNQLNNSANTPGSGPHAAEESESAGTIESRDFPQLLQHLVPIIEQSAPAAIGIILDQRTSPKDLPKSLLSMRANLVIGTNHQCESAGFTVTDTAMSATKEHLTYKMPRGFDRTTANAVPFSSALVQLYDTANRLPPNKLLKDPPGRYLTVNVSHDFPLLPAGALTTKDAQKPTLLPPMKNKIVLIAQRSRVEKVAVPTRIISQLDLQAQVIASLLHFDAYVDMRYKSFEFWMLPVSLMLSALFALLRPMPRFILWIATCATVIATVQYYFMALNIITIFSTVMLLVHCCYLCGTIIFLETETVERKRGLALAIQERAESERKRIARELHDDVLPALSRIMRMVDARQDNDSSGSDSGEIRERLETVVDSTRRIVNDLHPTILENLGLVPAIEHLAMRFSSDAGIEAKLVNNTDKEDFSFPSSTKLSIYRIVQEALNNIEKHAEAKCVCITLSCKDHLLTISIADDGKGFVPSSRRSDSAGLLNILQRAELIAAKVHWKKSEQFAQGTQLTLCLSIPETCGQT